MKRQNRLTSTTDFRRVRQTGKSYAHPLVLLIASPTGHVHTRYGVTAGRSVGSAVKRNRAKRRMREALGMLHPTVRPGWDVLLVARPGLIEIEWPDLVEAVLKLLIRANLIEDTK